MLGQRLGGRPARRTRNRRNRSPDSMRQRGCSRDRNPAGTRRRRECRSRQDPEACSRPALCCCRRRERRRIRARRSPESGTALACSPAMRMSAACTGPQVKPSTNWPHSPIAALFESVCCGSETVSALERTRNPLDPVSTSTPSIVWQFELPGAQSVTLVNAPLKYVIRGPRVHHNRLYVLRCSERCAGAALRRNLRSGRDRDDEQRSVHDAAYRMESGRSPSGRSAGTYARPEKER